MQSGPFLGRKESPLSGQPYILHDLLSFLSHYSTDLLMHSTGKGSLLGRYCTSYTVEHRYKSEYVANGCSKIVLLSPVLHI